MVKETKRHNAEVSNPVWQIKQQDKNEINKESENNRITNGGGVGSADLL